MERERDTPPPMRVERVRPGVVRVRPCNCGEKDVAEIARASAEMVKG